MQATYDNMLPPPEAKGSSHILFTDDGFRLRQHYQFLTSAFCLKKTFLRGNELKEIVINAKL
jgi:hypothetical protein